MSKNFPKCPNVFWGVFFEKVFFPSVPWSHRKLSKNQKKNSKTQKCPTSFPKLSKLVLNMFCGSFFEKKLPRVQCRVGPSKFFQNSKKFNIPKLPKFVSKSVQTCFQHALGRFFRLFLPSVPCRAFQIFWTWKYEFSFPDLKIRVSFTTQYSTDILFAFTPQSKYAIPFQMSLTENCEFRFPNLKF